MTAYTLQVRHNCSEQMCQNVHTAQELTRESILQQSTK